jgi:mannosyltransferase
LTSATENAPRPLAPPAPEPRVRRGLTPGQADWLIVAGLGVLAAFLCLLELTSRSIGFDEAATVTIAAQNGHALFKAVAHDGGNMSGFYLLLHVLMGWFGNGLLVIRLPSALASVATVVLVTIIGRRLFGRQAGAASGLIAAVSLPLVYWAQNARGYALMVAFVCGAYLVFISLQDKPRWRGWAAWLVLMSLATYSSFVAILVIPAQLVMLLMHERGRRQLGRFAVAVAAMAVICLPLIGLAARRGSGQLFWVPRPTREIEVQVLQSLTSAGLQPNFHATSTTTLLLVLTVVLLIAVASAYLPDWRRDRWRWEVGLIVMWVLVPVLLTLGYSFLFQPLFLPRNLLMSVPAVSVLLGAGLVHPRLPRPLGLSLLALLIVLRAAQLVPSYGASPEPWQTASTYVLDHSRTDDCLAFYPADGRMAFQYYQGSVAVPRRQLPRPILPIVRWGVVRTYVEDYATLSGGQLARRTARCPRLWLVSSHEGQPDGPARSRDNRRRFKDLQVRLNAAYRYTHVVQLGYASAIHVRLLSDLRR